MIFNYLMPDLLRCLGIIFVLAYHFQIRRFEFGYLGVDIFFALSGFLLVKILCEGKYANFRIFFLSRLKRLVPSLYLVSFLTILIGYFIFFPSDYKNVSQAAATALMFTSNQLFLMESSYFGGASITKPLLHTWSLCVELQAYIFIAATYYLVPKKYFMSFSLLVYFASLTAFIALSYDIAFYTSPTRLHQIYLGCFSYMLLQNRVSKTQLIALIIGTFIGVCFTDFSLHLISAAVASAMLTSMRTFEQLHVNQTLRNCISYVASLAYSMYLVHWPIFVFTVYLSTHNNFTTLLMLLGTFGSAVLLKKYEDYYRYNRFNSVVPVVLIFAAVFILSIFGQLYNGWASRPVVPERMQTLFASSLYSGSYTDINANPCSSDKVFVCTIKQDVNGPNILFYGDSHIGDYSKWLARNGYDANLFMLSVAGCNPFKSDAQNKACTSGAKLINKVIVDKDIDVLVVQANWAGYQSDDKIDGPVVTRPLQNIEILIIPPRKVFSIDAKQYAAFSKDCAVIQFNPDAASWVRYVEELRLLSSQVSFLFEPQRNVDVDCSSALVREKLLYRDDDHLSDFGVHEFMGKYYAEILHRDR